MSIKLWLWWSKEKLISNYVSLCLSYAGWNFGITSVETHYISSRQ